jgi:phage/plasmid-like protein (TIGR03299 family)
MSHEITEFDSMFSADGITPRHRLGHVAEGRVTLAEGLKLAGLDWGIEKRPIFIETVGGEKIELPDRVALVRDDIELPLGVVAPSYEVFDNIEGFDVLDELMGRGDVELATAGSLMKGRRVWALAKLDREVKLPGGDKIMPYLLAAFGHDGHFGIRYGATPIRVVCGNTLTWALKDTGAFASAYHTKNVRTKLEAEARRILGFTESYYDSFESEVRELIEKSVTEKQFTNVLARVFPMPEDKEKKRKMTGVTANREAVRAIYAESKTIGDYKGSGWGVVQAFSTWDLWSRPVRGVSDLTIADAAVVRDEAQTKRLLNGTADAFITDVRKKVLALS